ncbi:MAG: formate/nitrite transporter family protein [Mailhella sp.]|nr:formate/nitrite transporter family protein [Mailhella sp.]
MIARCFIPAIMAGVLISLGCCAYASVENHIVGAMLFALGLMSVVMYRRKLYTGMAGMARSCADFFDLVVIFLGNLLGCCLLAVFVFMAHLQCMQQLGAIAAAKLAVRPWHEVLFAAVICGALMEIGVAAWRSDREVHTAKSFITIASVMVFILIGAEHSVANCFYLMFGHGSLLSAILFIAICFVGNGIGGQLVNRLSR